MVPNNLLGMPIEAAPLFKELADHCETNDFRMLDKALFSYGALDERTFSD